MTLQVIGAGLPRTGTSSLKVALEMLGFGPCHHMTEVLIDPDSAIHWTNAADGKLDGLDIALKGFNSCVDAPAYRFYQELAARHPKAKVILSLRGFEGWFTSTQDTILQPNVMLMHRALGTLEMVNKVGWGEDPRLHNKAFMKERFERHDDEVRKAIPAERLLAFEAKDGWQPLCAFLGVPVPSAPYPHVNSKEEMAAMLSDEAIKMFTTLSRDQLVGTMRQMLSSRGHAV